MRKYDFKSIKRYIQMHSDVIDSVSLGMKEDWFWTAQTIYENERFTIMIDEPGLKISGISGSSWATPIMEITFKDGTEIFKNAYTGEATEQKPEWFSLGCMSQPCQNAMDEKTTPKIACDV